jgi:hypothetical protein
MQKLITKEIEKAILKTPYGTTDGVPLDEKKVIARFFNPCGAGTWYVLEDSDFKENEIVFGAVTLGFGLELGDFSIAELRAIKLPFFLRIERDISVEPFKETLGELRKRYCEDWM